MDSPDSAAYAATRARGPDAYDAGLHSESALGEIYVGLAVEPGSLGIVIAGPVVGRLRAVFDVDDSGKTGLSLLARSAPDGDELKVRPLTPSLQAEIISLRSEVAERAEALRGALQAKVRALAEARASSEARERLAVELKAERTALAQARTRLDAVEAELAAQRARHAEAESRLTEGGVELAAERQRLAEVKARASAADRDLEKGHQAQAEVQAQLAAATEALETERRLHAETQAQLATATEALEIEQRLHAEAQAQLAATTEALETERRLHAEAQAQLAATTEALETERRLQADLNARLTAADTALKDRQTQLERAQAEVDTVRREATERAQALSVKLGEEGSRATSAEAEVAKLKAVLAATEDRLKQRNAHVALVEKSAADSAHRSGKLSFELEAEKATVAELRAALEKEQQGHATVRLAATDAAARASKAEATAAADLARVTKERDLALAEVQSLKAALETEKALSAEQKERIEEEERRRDEMIADIAFIQTQVKDLSSTKGDLVNRISKMANREDRRRASAVELNDMLRTAEVVAHDKKTSLARMQSHAQKLEEQVVALTTANTALEGEVAEAARLRQVVAELTAQRDGLKVDISYFQKQLAAKDRKPVASSPSGIRPNPLAAPAAPATPARPPPKPQAAAPAGPAPLPVGPAPEVGLPTEWDERPAGSAEVETLDLDALFPEQKD